MHVYYPVVLQKVGNRFFVVLSVIVARCHASYVYEATNIIFLKKAKEIIEWVCGVPPTVSMTGLSITSGICQYKTEIR
jgi:hypothetical protein